MWQFLRGGAFSFSVSLIAPSLLAALVLFLLFSSPSPVVAQDIIWVRQFGTPSLDTGDAVAVDGSGNTYVAGRTDGTFPGQTMAGAPDVYVRKYDPAGTVLWTRQFGSSTYDEAHGVAVDGGGNVYVVGSTYGALPGQTAAGLDDAYVRKYDSSGSELWTRQFGIYNYYDEVNGVAVDGGGNVYVAGLLGSDAFVRKYDPAGSELWTRQLGSLSARSVAVDGGGNAYVAGDTGGTLPGQTSAGGNDGFVRKYDPAGSELWTRQFGTPSNDNAYGVAVDASGNAYVAGSTPGTFPDQTSAGGGGAFVRKYDSAGSEHWTRQFGSASAGSVAVDGGGNVYVAGNTNGTLPGETSAGFQDAFVRKYASAGTLLWTRQFGTSNNDYAYGVAADGDFAYVAGYTVGAFPGQTAAGVPDAYLAKIAPDADGDGVLDHVDNCLNYYNPTQDPNGCACPNQMDSDGDGRGDPCDACPATAPAASIDYVGCSQAQVDGDLDAICDPGRSSLFCAGLDNCPGTANTDQIDGDVDGFGTACDNCPTTANDQANHDGDSEGNTCDGDDDGDGWIDGMDNCPVAANPLQEDADSDLIGDACDTNGQVMSALLDMNVGLSPANRSTQVGSVEACKRINENGILDADEDVVDGVYVDLVLPAPGVPPGYNLQAFNALMEYDSLHVRVAARDYDHLLSANGSAYWGVPGGTVPDSDGSFGMFVQDYSPNYETGEGILTRLTLETVSTAPGLATAEIAFLVLTGTSAPQLVPGALGSAMIAANAGCGDPDGDSDSVPDWADNCPSLANAAQSNNDLDGQGDACDPNDDNDAWEDTTDLCPTVYTGWLVSPGDSDCDGYPDSAQAGARAPESVIGTLPSVMCSSTATANDEPLPDAWPPDFNDSRLVNGADILSFNSRFGSSAAGGSPYDVRWDLNASGLINGADVLQLNPFFGKSCSG